MKEAVLHPFIDAFTIHRRVAELALQIKREFTGTELAVVSVLKGSFMFTADLVRRLYEEKVPIQIDFLQVSSYGSGTESSGNLKLTQDLSMDIRGHHVLLVDDILDTGRTSAFVHEHLKERDPAWLKTCMFLDKPARRVVPFKPDFVGFTVPDAFVVGYGLDFDGRYRERPDLSLVRFKDGSPELQFSFQVREGAICLKGRLDSAGAGPLGESLMNWTGSLVLDMKELAFLDRGGADLIQKACSRASGAGWPVKIRKAAPEIRRLLEESGIAAVVWFA
jgi:hypoxanthine phosphoribosyltransferase